ncbi:MAG: hypothetical protein KC414_14775, partial [Romboutsia sp.]|nr:hypothetical protein [Romboutsia sp.]
MMKTKFIIIVILLTLCIGTNTKDSISINNKHSIQPSLEVSFISGKPTVYVGLGLGLNYSYNFHKYLAIESELLYTHGFKTSNDMVVFPSVDILIGEYRFTPVKTQLVVFSTYFKSYLLNKPNNKLSVGLGITTRGTFDKRNDYIEYYFMGSDNYRVESN